jgi:hypothetical protein
VSFRYTFTAIRANAKQLLPLVIREDLRFYTKEYAQDVIEDAKAGYGTAPKESYTRTGRYGLYMVAKNTSSGGNIQYTITNPVQDPWGRYYAHFVSGSDQASFHAGRWPKLSDLLKRKNFDRGAQRIITKGIKLA